MSGRGGADLIQVRMLVQYAYCRRLGYMELAQGEFAYNEEVEDGRYQHRNVDRPAGGRGPGGEGGGEDRIHARSVELSDPGLGLTGRIDLLEAAGGEAVPVEYKRGEVPDTPGRTHRDHRVQVCAQGLLLRAKGWRCERGVVYYIGSKQRVDVALDDAAVAETLQLLADMREDVASGSMPPPLVDSPKCPRCSLVGICLPDETNMLSGDPARGIGPEQVRRMYPVRGDAVPMYVQEQGAYVSKSGESLVVKVRGEAVRKARLIDVSELGVFGGVQVTTQALRALCERGAPVCYFTYGGWLYGMTTGAWHKNAELRARQHAAAADGAASLAIAREMVYGKVRNCATMLRRNCPDPPEGALGELDGLARRARGASRYDSLLGIEGMAARTYFSGFPGMLKGGAEFDFTGRNRRPPKDPVNAVLSFLYAMLHRQAATTAAAVGFDPYIGFLHRPKYGRAALGLDLMEEFRPIVADSVCLTLVNNGELTGADVTVSRFGASLTGPGRRKVIEAHERRMYSSATHPLLGYSASYRRIIETQARLLSRHLLGEIPSYPAFRTR